MVDLKCGYFKQDLNQQTEKKRNGGDWINWRVSAVTESMLRPKV